MGNNSADLRKQAGMRIDPRFIAEAVALLKTDKRLRHGDLRVNPVTGYRFVHAIDPIRRQVVEAASALQARARFATLHPDLPTLPLCWDDRERMKRGDIGHLVAWFARSLAGCGYDLDGHPSFDDYVRNDVLSDPDMRQLFPADVADRFLPRRGVK
jgi:hypothetical protein